MSSNQLNEIAQVRARYVLDVYKHIEGALGPVGEEGGALNRKLVAASLTQSFFSSELRDELRAVATGEHVPAIASAIKAVAAQFEA